jgi:glycosyltransferase involved in cell wall biosynthesis
VRLFRSPDTLYLSYVHSPARYLWTPGLDRRGDGRLLAAPRRALRRAELRLSRHVHAYAANSREVRDRIQRHWGRDAEVVHPPVDVEFFAAGTPDDRAQDRRYLLGAGRWVPYKNFDLMIEIADQARIPLVIAGSGPEETRLRRLAAKATIDVRFEVHPCRTRLRTLYWGAVALLSPAREDFGMVPVEAQACQTPIIGMSTGGLLDTVVHGETGYLDESADPSAMAGWVRRLNGLSHQQMARNAARFSPMNFEQRLSAWIEAGAAA